jgi:ParB family transcriptional regulator, chromosome partitioning protein
MQFQNNAIFWVEVEKIKPNPYQPRREFDEERLNDLADSIRQYGVLQPLVVTRQEIVRDDGGISVEYELIAGERRHRASRIAGISQVPVIIKSGPENDKLKLELAIIENLQREDLNAIDRALAFHQLADEFGFKHAEIAKKVGKSREYVSNSIRLLSLPEEMQQAIKDSRMSEGHARPLLMLGDRPQEQDTLFKEVVYKKITVREAESIARQIAQEKVRKQTYLKDPKINEYEKQLSESLGTRVQIEQGQVGGKIVINFFSPEDLQSILDVVTTDATMTRRGVDALLNRYIEQSEDENSETNDDVASFSEEIQVLGDNQLENSESTPQLGDRVFSNEACIEEKNTVQIAQEKLHSENAEKMISEDNQEGTLVANESLDQRESGEVNPQSENNSNPVFSESIQQEDKEESKPESQSVKEEEGDDIYSIARFSL